MMRNTTLTLPLALATGLAFGSMTAHADPDCTCRGNGTEIPEGQTVCLKTASGMKLARCERVLNNTSWTFIQDGCPTASLVPESRPVIDFGRKAVL